MFIRSIYIAAAALVLVAVPSAQAQLELAISFDVSEASTQEFVKVQINGANRGSEALLADVGLTVSYGEVELGPLGGKLRLPAESEFAVEHDLYLVPIPMAGDLTIDLSLSHGEDEVAASASVAVTVELPGQRPEDGSGMAEGLIDALLAITPVDTETRSVASFKADFVD